MAFVILFSVPEPSVSITQSMEGAVIGENHNVTCTVTVTNGISPSAVMIRWTGGSSFSDSPRVTVSDQTNIGVVYTRTVAFSPLLNADGGKYTCTVSVTDFDEANSSSSVIVAGKEVREWTHIVLASLINNCYDFSWLYMYFSHSTYVLNKHYQDFKQFYELRSLPYLML